MNEEEKLSEFRRQYALERQWVEIQWDNLKWVQHWEYQYEETYLLPYWKYGYWRSISE